MVKVITAPDVYTPDPEKQELKIFLAGGITNCPNWQQKVIENIKFNHDYEDKDYNVILFNPRRELFDINNKEAVSEQIAWEFMYLELCDLFTMYFADGPSDQPICMYELGRNIARIQAKFPCGWKNMIIVSSETEYKRYNDVYWQLYYATVDEVSLHNCLDNHIKAINNFIIRRTR